MIDALGIHDLALFVGAGLLLNITPGADMLYVAGHAAGGGRRAGLLAALGIGAGCLVHVALAALGLSAVLAASDLAFTVVKWLGAAYLVWMGIGMLRSRAATPAGAAAPPAPASARAIFLQGFLTNALNPKVALFFLAFVPQFIAPDAPSKPLAFLVLGLVFDFNGMLWCHALALSTAFASRRLQPGAAIGRWLNRAMGGLFVALGVRLALATR